MATSFIRGFTFPLSKGTTSFLSQSIDDDLIRQSILQILLTRRGERVMRSTFGSGLLDIVFDTADPSLVNRIREEIYASISQYEPRIIIRSIDVDISDKPNVVISMTYINKITQQQKTIAITDITAAS